MHRAFKRICNGKNEVRIFMCYYNGRVFCTPDRVSPSGTQKMASLSRFMIILESLEVLRGLDKDY